MKRILIMLSALTLLCACGQTNKGRAVEPTADNPRDALAKELFSLVESGKIAYGHQDDLVYGHSWKVEDIEKDTLGRSDVKAVTGKFPKVVGFELGGIELGWDKSIDRVPFDLMRRAVRTHVKRGGIVTFSWHPHNIFTGGTAWDVSSKEVVKSALPGGAKHAEFKLWLQRTADFFESLGPDVAFIFRPWHENIGSWFWWGGELCTAQEYIDLYRLTWHYITKERGLTNILWCYSPNGPITPQDYMSRYPGDDCIDLLGTDIYEYPGSDSIEDAGVHYSEQVKGMLTILTAISQDHEKLVCFSETGLEGIPDMTWWTKTLLPAIEDFPICYVLTWRNAHDMPGHFYAPWEGFEGAADFKAFSELDKIVFLK